MSSWFPKNPPKNAKLIPKMNQAEIFQANWERKERIISLL